MDKLGLTSGAQSLRRALMVLRMLGQNQEEGLTLVQVIERVGLERSTVHRLLTCLVEEGFVERQEKGKVYRLGIDAVQLGTAGLRRMPLIDKYDALLQRLARISGDTVFFVIRQGDFCLCLQRQEGHFPVRVFTTNVGEKRLLGIGAGGLALMATLPDEEIAALVQRHAKNYAQMGFSLADMMVAVRETRQAGYSRIVDTITEGVSGVGCAFQVSPTQWAALSFGAISQRLPLARQHELGALLLQEALRQDF
ncbi:IclR family transcriptional regulator [Lampropedia aestuarii]|uniref:IclR family transcriptional regulator n=1 Tax=Lampropedia aestuarii TaxID=2562762 RepID=A0A4S5BP46_9BURK|nr:IclR family transcriptional regulator [Lampropedia aestuarii]THJ31366.1 IclR family transcriptional regulator [Lampropedia aestuarii]